MTATRMSSGEKIALVVGSGAVITVAAVLASKAGGGSGGGPGPGPGPGGSFKPPLRGVGPRGTAVPSVPWQLFGVMSVPWRDLQSAPGAAINRTALDQAISHWRAFNVANPQYAQYGGGGFKLRTGGAGGAPDGVKHIVGSPVTVTDAANGATTTVGHFWTPQYCAAYQDFQQKLAAYLDAIPEFRENVMGLPGMVYEEPMRRYSTDVLSVAGWTMALDEAAFTSMLNIHAGAWRTTLQDMAFNPYNWPGGGDPAFTNRFMTACRTKLGKQCVLGNNSIRDTTSSDGMYQAIASLGHPVYFQTAASSRLGDPATTFNFAIAHKANSVELPSGAIATSVLQAAQAGLLANPV